MSQIVYYVTNVHRFTSLSHQQLLITVKNIHLATLVTVTSFLNVSTSVMQDVIGAVFFLLSLVKQAQPLKVSLLVRKMKYVVENSAKRIDAWKPHLRSTDQDQARLDVLQSLNQESTLLVLDWTMKFLSRKFRESQTDSFGKRGISWLITVATRKNKDGEIEMLTFVHVFKKCNQDSGTVVAILDDVFKQLTSIAPEISTIYLRQDNAECYHSASTLLAIQQVAAKNKLQLSRVDFSDSQGMKGSCNRKAATIRNDLKIYLNSGHDIETAEQMLVAMESLGGVPSVRVTLCGPQSPVKLRVFKWDGVSFLNNTEYTRDGIRVWRVYNVGKEKFIPWSEFNIQKNLVCPKLNTVKEANHACHISFYVVKARRSSEPLPDP